MECSWCGKSAGVKKWLKGGYCSEGCQRLGRQTDRTELEEKEKLLNEANVKIAEMQSALEKALNLIYRGNFKNGKIGENGFDEGEWKASDIKLELEKALSSSPSELLERVEKLEKLVELYEVASYNILKMTDNGRKLYEKIEALKETK